MSEGYKDLTVYKEAYKAAMEIYELTKSFPKEEIYSLTDQIRRSSRGVCVGIGEGYRKRIYPKHFTAKMTDADSECTETLIWLDFSWYRKVYICLLTTENRFFVNGVGEKLSPKAIFLKDCNYIKQEVYEEKYNKYKEIGRMLGSMANNPGKFLPRSNNY